MLKAVGAPAFVCLKDHLGVAFGPKTRSQRKQLRTQFLVVIDFSIEHDDQDAIDVFHRLIAVRIDVNDSEAGMAERDRPVGQSRLIIRPPRPHPLDRPAKLRRYGRILPVQNPGNPAHQTFSAGFCPRTVQLYPWRLNSLTF